MLCSIFYLINGLKNKIEINIKYEELYPHITTKYC